MNSGIRRIEEVIDYIEEHIEEDIDHTLLASKMTLSLYEFRRIFSFIVGCPLSDYLRKRRLSLAACELVSSQKSSIRSISEKFGYSTEAAFSKAFKEHHGISPTQCQRGDGDIRLFTRPEFEFTVSGRSTVPFRIISDTAFKVDGIKMVSPYSDTSCCDAVWTKFYDDGYDGNIKSDKIYATYLSSGGEILCTIGERNEDTDSGTDIPSAVWACFTMTTTDDSAVDEKYSEILYSLLPSAALTRREDIPTVEVFPRDMENEGFEWEIRIAVSRID